MTQLQIGDVISSKEFSFGSYNLDFIINGVEKIILVDGKTTTLIHDIPYSEDEKLAYAIKHNKFPTGYKKIEYGAYDSTRGSAKFVVESVKLEGGSERDGYKDEPHILARRLFDSGLYDPDGELITFYYPKVNLEPSIKTIEIHGRMKKVFI